MHKCIRISNDDVSRDDLHEAPETSLTNATPLIISMDNTCRQGAGFLQLLLLRTGYCPD